MNSGPVPTPRPPATRPTITPTLLLSTLDPTTLKALRHIETVRDDPGGILYLTCTWTPPLVRRIILTARPDGRYDVADQLVRPHPWRVTVTATRVAVERQHLPAKLRELARTQPPPPVPRRPTMPPTYPTPPPHEVTGPDIPLADANQAALDHHLGTGRPGHLSAWLIHPDTIHQIDSRDPGFGMPPGAVGFPLGYLPVFLDTAVPAGALRPVRIILTPPPVDPSDLDPTSHILTSHA